MPRATQDSDSIAPDFVYGTLTLSGQPFQCCSSILRNFPIGPSTPYQSLRYQLGLDSSAFARHYSRNLFFSSGYLDVSLPRVPHPWLCVHHRLP